MASLTQSVDRIDKLNGGNYRSWKFNMKMALIQRELWQHVTGEASRPEEGEAEIERFNRKEEKALAAIALSVEPEQQGHIIDSKTAADAWEALKKVFEPKSRPRILQLKKQMVSIQLEPEETMTSYLERIRTCSDSLKEAGYEIKDDDLAYAMLSGLPDSYEGIIMALANLEDSKFKSSEVKGILLSEYDRRAAKGKDKAGGQKEAHHQVKETSRQKPDGKREDRKCFKCDKQGHIAKYCKAASVRNNYKSNALARKQKDTFLLEINNTQLDNHWLLDSGATHHICKHRNWFNNYKRISNEIIYSADSHSKGDLNAIGIGDINIETSVNNNVFSLTLQNVYHVPNIRRNLLSVSQIEMKNKKLIFNNGGVKILNKRTRMIVGEAFNKDGLYIIKAENIKGKPNQPETYNVNSTKLNESQKWHQRLGHINIRSIKELSDKNLVRGLEDINVDNINCDGCNVSKSTKAPCKRIKGRHTKTVLELVHSDLCGPMPSKSIGGSEYFLTFTDDYSRKTTVYCLKGKNEVASYTKRYIARVERETDQKLKRIRTDNGLEFCNKELITLFNELGIKHERTNTYTPQMNGVAERINRTLLDMARAMLKTAQLPERFWAEALLSACYIKNRVTHSEITDNVPEGIWTENRPSVKHLKTYGCLAYAHIPKQKRNKLDSRAKECIFVGYSNQTKGYRLWDPVVDDVIQTKHVEFVEEICGYEYIYKKRTYDIPVEEGESDDNVDNNAIIEKANVKIDRNEEYKANKTQISEIEEIECSDNESDTNTSTYNLRRTEARKTTPVCTTKRDKVVRNPWGRTGKPKDIEINLTEITEPVSFEQAMASPQRSEWELAMKDELNSLENRDTWEIVEEVEHIKYIGSKWVYKVKTDTTGKIIKYKARLVAQGYNQKKNVDYFDSYAPVASMSTIRVLLAMSITQGWEVHHLDVKCAYLYGDLAEDIYMKLPTEYDKSDIKIVKLKKPIYGLKQSGRNWNNAIDTFLIENGFQRLKSNNCVYTYDDELILTIYVDDIVLFAKNINKLEQAKLLLMSRYEMRDLGRVSYLLGIRISYDMRTIKLSQKLYIEKLLTEYNMDECKMVKTPTELGLKLSKTDSPSNEIEREEMRNIPYRQLIGSLMYVALATRPDILYSTTKLSQFVSNPGRIHWIQAKRILRYLAATKDKCLTYSVGSNEIEVFSDADWAADVDDRHSYSGMIVFMGGNAVSWKSCKQKSISTSTMEAEYVALANAVKEIMSMNMMFDELRNVSKVDAPCKPYVIRCDNKSAIDFTLNRVERSKSKHIDIAYHLTREKYEEGLIQLKYVASEDNVADLFTKGLPYTVMNIHVHKLKLQEYNNT